MCSSNAFKFRCRWFGSCSIISVGRLGVQRSLLGWVFIKGGCSRRGVQWMGVVLHSKTAYNIM